MKTKLLPSYGYSAAMLFIALCCTPNLLLANPLQAKTKVEQNKVTITGKVTDESGALPGVIVQIVGTKTATLTDHDGNYSIQVDLGSELSYSYMGYTTKKVIVTSTDKLNITLSQDSQELGEIVVNAGYYTVKDRERTGSIARVTAKDFEFQPVTNPLQAIQGRVAGVDITQESGLAGGGMKIEIRGRNFMDTGSNTRNQPLYIINGVPIDSQPLGVNGLISSLFPTGISPLNSINPSDIESIEILKDADATSIYGSRGANGVILITTKQGNREELKFTISSSLSYSKVANFLKMMDTSEYLTMRKEAFENQGISNYPGSSYDINGAWDQNHFTDWQKELLGKTAVNKNISLGVSAGTELTAYNINFNHSESTTVFPTDKGYTRNSLLINFNQRNKNNTFKLNTSLNYSDQGNNLPTLDLTNQAVSLSPNAPKLFTPTGELNWGNNTFANPLAQLKNNYENDIKSLILNSSLNYNITDNLSFLINGGITSLDLTERSLMPHTAINPAYNLTSEQSSSRKNTTTKLSYIIEPQLNYELTYNKSSFAFLIGGTYQTNSTDHISISGSNFTSNAFIRNMSSAKVVNIIKNNFTEYKYAALFSRLNYSYDSKYFVNLTARRDGSSRFSKNNKFGNFGSVGIGWIISKEDFFRNNKHINFAKLRASYGITGSDNIGDYAYLDIYNLSAAYNSQITLAPNSLYNPNYKWEKTTKFEIALEASFFKEKLKSSLAYYYNKSSDQLVGYTLPTTTGFNSILKNSPAVVVNYGLELTLQSENIKTPNFAWTTNFNISLPKNKLQSYPGLEEGTQNNIFIIGKPLNISKVYEYKGLNPDTGLFEFTDFNNDGLLNALDKKIIKDLTPKYYGGIQNTLSYKNLTLDFLFYFMKKEAFNQDKIYYNTPGAAVLNLPKALNDRWSTENPTAKYMQSTYNNNQAAMLTSIYRDSESVISDGSYIRLKNLSISYLLKLPSTTKTEFIRIYFQGQNLWTYTNYFGQDPEFTIIGHVPPLKTYSFGIQLTF